MIKISRVLASITAQRSTERDAIQAALTIREALTDRCRSLKVVNRSILNAVLRGADG